MRELNEPEVLNQILNALLLFLISVFFWSWLGEATELPMNVILGLGSILLALDLKDYSEDPQPKPLLVGAALVPFWMILRFVLRGASER